MFHTAFFTNQRLPLNKCGVPVRIFPRYSQLFAKVQFVLSIDLFVFTDLFIYIFLLRYLTSTEADDALPQEKRMRIFFHVFVGLPVSIKLTCFFNSLLSDVLRRSSILVTMNQNNLTTLDFFHP